MSRSGKMLFSVIFSIALIIQFTLIPTSLVSEIMAAPPDNPAGQPSGPPGNAEGPPLEKTTYKTIPISMEMEAGAALYKEWPGGQKTIHAGIGWIHPFGRGEYVAGMGYPEAKNFPEPSYFNEEWMETYSTRLFCIYRLSDGDIYAYDGVVGNLDPYDSEVDDGKMDYLMNVIVGGTGAYEGARGMLLGRTPGKGASTEVSGGISLPVSILKLMEGYIQIPVKE